MLFFVANVESAKHWYSDLLGETPYFDEEGYVAFRLANVTIGLHPNDEKNASGAGGQVTYWHVSDIQQTSAHFGEQGCHKSRGSIIGVDQIPVCQLIDPFGTLWGLARNLKAFNTWTRIVVAFDGCYKGVT